MKGAPGTWRAEKGGRKYPALSAKALFAPPRCPAPPAQLRLAVPVGAGGGRGGGRGDAVA